MWRIILDIYLIFIFVYFVLKVFFADRKMLSALLFFVLVFTLSIVANHFDLLGASVIYSYIRDYGVIVLIIILAPELRRTIEISWQTRTRKEDVVMGSDNTRETIIDATMELAKTSTGAIITIEKHNTLEMYAEKAVMLNSNVTKELILNIFTPNTPLHDGAVIIRGDQILCAGAYFLLTSREDFEKTMGSRHRAGLGISEVTDSFTIVVSEETGSISIAIEGVMLKINDREKLTEYLTVFMR